MTGGRLRLLRFVVACYPRTWRARYGDEVIALVDETGLSVSQALDLLRGAAAEQTRAAAESVWTSLSMSRRERLSNGRHNVAVMFTLPLILSAIFRGAAVLGNWLIRPRPPEGVLGVLAAISLVTFVAAFVRFYACRPSRIRPTEDAAFMRDLDRYSMPRINRAVALFSYRAFGVGAVAPRPESPKIGLVEGIAWLAALAISRVTVEWLFVSAHLAWQHTWSLFSMSQLFVTFSSAVAQTQRATSDGGEIRPLS